MRNRYKKHKDILQGSSRQKNNTYVIFRDSGVIGQRRAAIVLSLHFDELRPRPTLPKAPMIPYKGVTWRALAFVSGWFDRCEARCIVSLRNKSVRVTSLSRGLTKVHHAPQRFQHRRRFAVLRLLLTGHGFKIQEHQWVRVFFSCRV